jgi:hypothetical protein
MEKKEATISFLYPEIYSIVLLGTQATVMTIRQFHGIRHSNSYTSFLSTPDMRVQI